jgi:hypothetical protein
MEVDDKQARFFLLLSKAGAWDIVNGSVLIHIDYRGEPIKAETRQFVDLSPTRSIDLQVVV